jgi:hypothetical protein
MMKTMNLLFHALVSYLHRNDTIHFRQKSYEPMNWIISGENRLKLSVWIKINEKIVWDLPQFIRVPTYSDYMLSEIFPVPVVFELRVKFIGVYSTITSLPVSYKVEIKFLMSGTGTFTN